MSTSIHSVFVSKQARPHTDRMPCSCCTTVHLTACDEGNTLEAIDDGRPKQDFPLHGDAVQNGSCKVSIEVDLPAGIGLIHTVPGWLNRCLQQPKVYSLTGELHQLM